MPVALPVLVAWLVVVAVWSTTPLFLHFSTLAFPASLAGGLRMAVAALVLLLVLAALGRGLPREPRARLAGLAMLPGVFGSMYLSYLAAQRIPTGLISVVFGLSPVLSALFARWWLDEPALGLRRGVAVTIALCGLALVMGVETLATGTLDVIGVACVCAATLLFSASGVAVKRIGQGFDPMTQTAGALVLSLPLYALAWLAEGRPQPAAGQADFPLAVMAILYLAVIGSVLGFVCYYHVLQHMSAAGAALITVVTPVFALALGALLNGEHFTGLMLAGAALVLAGVAGFLFEPAGLRRVLRRRSGFTQTDNSCAGHRS
ncbi:MAG: DMT family transporter [Pseudomonadota bacterium]